MNPDNSSIETLDKLATKLAKKRRLAQVTRGDLALEAEVSVDVIERIETGRPVAYEDLVAVLDTIDRAQALAGLRVPQPRTEASPDDIASA